MDKIVLAQEIGIKVPNADYWKGHHIEYSLDTNTMRMQFVVENYHAFPHFGGAGEFERITGLQCGSPEAKAYCKQRNIEYLLQLFENIM